MWNEAGQIDHLTFAGQRGGGKGGGGGGGQQQYVAPTYTDPVTGRSFSDTGFQIAPGVWLGEHQSGADQLNAFIGQREAGEKAKSDQAAAEKTAADAATRSQFESSRDAAYNDARSNVIRQFQLQGLDPNAYMESDINPRLAAARNSIRDLDPNPSAAFSPDLGASIINDLSGGVRTRGLNDLNAIFTPTYSSTNLTSSIANPYVDQIVSEQFDPLTAQLENARKRGILNETGYGAALNTLGQKRSGARATVSSLGENILAGNRSELDDYINSARSAANSATINSGFDPNAYTSRAHDMVNTDVGNFGGALRNATAGTQFANLSDLLNAGGAVQGGANTSPLDAAGGIGNNAPAPADLDALANKKRGLGNQGAF